ncbi:hypothetical protein TNCV_4578591 [Trichonephila clavipes]|nr:hypothetical protein TNCV_4578591 [Trichonephila clavipes]
MEGNTVRAKQSLDKCYPDSAPSLTMVKRVHADLKSGHTDTNDGELSGHPSSAFVPENIKIVHKIALADWKLKSTELKNKGKASSKCKRKRAVSQRQCSMSQIQEKDGQIESVTLRISSPPTLQSRYDPQWPLSVCRPKNNAPRKVVWLK